MKEFYSILKNSLLFKNIRLEDFDSTLSEMKAHLNCYVKNQVIWSSEKIVTETGVVVRGAVHVTKTDTNGNRIIFVEVKSGESFGEPRVFSDINMDNLSVISAKENTVVIFVPIKSIVEGSIKVCDNQNQITINILNMLANKVLSLHIKLDILSRKTMREKILAYLEYERERTNSSTVRITFSREELADYLNVNCSAMSRELGNMRGDGLINFSGNKFSFKSSININ